MVYSKFHQILSVSFVHTHVNVVAYLRHTCISKTPHSISLKAGGTLGIDENIILYQIYRISFTNYSFRRIFLDTPESRKPRVLFGPNLDDS